MKNYFRNLLAAIRGRRAQASVTAVVETFNTAATQLEQAREHLIAERYAVHDKIGALVTRDQALAKSVQQSATLAAKIRDFTA